MLKDSDQLMHEKLLYAMHNEPGGVQREGELDAIFQRHANVVVQNGNVTVLGTPQPLIDYILEDKSEMRNLPHCLIAGLRLIVRLTILSPYAT